MNIIFYRENFFGGTEFAIKSTQKYSPDSRIILIGDNLQDKNLTEFHNIYDYSNYRAEFEKIYKHNSHIDEWFVFSTISMYLVILEFIEKNKIGPFFLPDTDILTFSNIEDSSKPFSDFDYTESIPIGDSSQCPLIFNNIEVLADFRKYLLDIYRNLSNDIFQYDICAMQLWRFFRLNHSFKCGNTSKIINDSTFDHNLCQDYHDYEHDGESKVVKFKNGSPYIYNKRLQKDVKFNILHCWGKWKERMGELLDLAEKSKNTGKIFYPPK